MKNIFGQTICNKGCPAWNKEYAFCEAMVDFAGRVLPEDDAQFGVLCKLPDKFRIIRSDVETNENDFKNTAYEAIIEETERLEHAGTYLGNGHHLAQRLVKMLWDKFGDDLEPRVLTMDEVYGEDWDEIST